MSNSRRRFGFGLTLLLVLIGAFLGTLGAQLVGQSIPFMLTSLSFGIEPPATLRLWDVFSLTLGTSFNVNVGGALGILLVLLIFRRG